MKKSNGYYILNLKKSVPYFFVDFLVAANSRTL